MKYVVILGDGMADWPVEELGNKTPLQVANKPNIDYLCKNGITGLVKTVPDALPPGSDVANLSVMGYDPHLYYTGRSPLEAVSMGVEVLPDDTTFRTNLVTLSDEADYKDKKMVDYSSGEITTKESRELMKYVQENLGDEIRSFYGGISYRHLLLWHGLDKQFKLTPPHDISGKVIGDYLPDNEILLDLMKKSYDLLKDHPINKDRIKRGLNPANSIWMWGQGKKPALTSFKEKYGIKGAVISAVDLVKGIGICAQMDSIEVEGATGNIDTNFPGKAQAAIDALKVNDFVYIHMEAPDECGHHFEKDNKIKSIELIDGIVVKTVYEYLKNSGEDFSILVLPDHPTPLKIGTHTNDPVPFVIYRSDEKEKSGLAYNEEDAKNGEFVEKGHTLMSKFLS
ncbi:MAG: cofactor-independent phosphoglycerate mutase [Clostridia bacterium]|nr:cofactor-independent phosphoglycerate mutase [Clostridia bacterium]